jgi:hypothetical protein
MPKELLTEKQKKGQKQTTQRDHLLAIKWCDVRDVYLLSTAHDDQMVETPASRGAHQKTKPSAVLDYNKYKICVDKSDQMLSYYSFQRKSEVVEEIVFPPLQSCSCECPHFALEKMHKEIQIA